MSEHRGLLPLNGYMEKIRGVLMQSIVAETQGEENLFEGGRGNQHRGSLTAND
jgi:hypothetical protein